MVNGKKHYLNTMKYALIFLTSFLSLSGFSQSWAPFPLDETSEWRVSNGWLSGEGCLVQQQYSYSLGGQIVQNGHTYHQLYFSGIHWSQWTSVGSNACVIWPPEPLEEGPSYAVRVEDGKMYLANPTGEELLYDFTLEVGDTTNGFGVEYVVDSIDQISLNQHVCKRMWVTANYLDSEPIWIIENVGHSHGLFETMYEFENSSSLCYREDGIPLVFRHGGECSILSVSEEEESDFLVSPNPSSGIYNLSVQQQFNYQVFDLLGNMVLQGSGYGSSSIDLTEQPDGIYLLRIDSVKGSRTQKLLKQ